MPTNVINSLGDSIESQRAHPRQKTAFIGGAVKAIGALPGFRQVGQALSNKWIGGDPFSSAFNLYAGYQGARQGYEVGGVGGALAGGAGGFAGSRALMGGVQVGAGRLTSALGDQVAKGRMQWLKSNPGRIRNFIGNQVNNVGKGFESLGATGVGNWIQARGGNMMANAANAAAKNTPSALRQGFLPAVSTAGFIGLGAVPEQIKQTTMDVYKHTMGNINRDSSQRSHDLSQLRMTNPEMQNQFTNNIQQTSSVYTNNPMEQNNFTPNPNQNTQYATQHPQQSSTPYYG